MTESQCLVQNIKDVIAKEGSACLYFADTTTKTIKSISSWGCGIFYGNRLNQKNFSQSTHIDNIIFYD
jgi:hypothetical protein